MSTVKKAACQAFMYLVELVVILLSVFPIVWVVMSAFKTNGEILTSPLALPTSFSLDVFVHLFETYNFPVYFLNSLLAAGVSTLVTLVYLSAGMAMSIFVLKAGFMAIPKSLDEAAIIDGAGFMRTFWSINLPLAKSALATAGILMFLGNWNEYYFASLLTHSDSQRTLPIALSFFTSEFSYNYTNLFAALTIVILPGILLYVFAQEQVQASVAATGIKG